MQRNPQVRVLPAMVLPMPKRNKEETNQNGGRDSASGRNCVIFITALVGKNYTLPWFSSSQRTNGTPQQAKLPAIRSPLFPRQFRQEHCQRQRTPLLLLLHCSKTRLTTPWNRSKLCPGVEDISTKITNVVLCVVSSIWQPKKCCKFKLTTGRTALAPRLQR